MIGKQVVLVLPDGDPIQTSHRTCFRAGEQGVVVRRHPRWEAWIVRIGDVTAVFFPDEIKET